MQNPFFDIIIKESYYETIFYFIGSTDGIGTHRMS